MTSSIRTASLDETLRKAQAVARQLHITRVTDTTWLDRIGIPVYASIRPGAHRRSLAVNAGKGRWPKEAQVGAYMEAIEFAFAESSRHLDAVDLLLPYQVQGQPSFPHSLLSLCPVLGRRIDPDKPIACVEATEIFSGESAMIPAELVFNPFTDNAGQAIYGTSTNGLASGNTVEEASLHGLCELIERDVTSYQYINPTSYYVPVQPDTVGVPEDVAALVERIVAADLTVTLRYAPNEYELPYFQAHILEQQDFAPIAISTGVGLHLDVGISAVRAISEAAQSRLTFIHGGRDDIIDRYSKFEGLDGRAAELRAVAISRSRVTDQARSMSFDSVSTTTSHMTESIDDALGLLRDKLGRSGIERVYRYVLSPPDVPLAVVRVIAPGLEHFKPDFHRVGPRLAQFVSDL
ncbi:YcaO-like family protein [Nocardia wallacei]|nr:YcaO-like family protein [Nocardia wallacei]